MYCIDHISLSVYDISQSFEALRAQKYVTSFQESGINGKCLLGITSEADAEEFGIVFR
jgi:hypothetical protein